VVIHIPIGVKNATTNQILFLMMTTSFLDYYKMILDKVSFDHNLFMKEYQKATRNLHTNEIGDLNSWLRSKGFHAILSGNTQNTNSSVRA
jgi:N6-adenosine-specific RNA methylase IME4